MNIKATDQHRLNRLTSFPRATLIVIHKYFQARHSGRDCRNLEAMDGNAEEAMSVYIGMDSNLVVLQVFDQCGVPAESFTSLCSGSRQSLPG